VDRQFHNQGHELKLLHHSLFDAWEHDFHGFGWEVPHKDKILISLARIIDPSFNIRFSPTIWYLSTGSSAKLLEGMDPYAKPATFDDIEVVVAAVKKRPDKNYNYLGELLSGRRLMNPDIPPKSFAFATTGGFAIASESFSPLEF